MSQTTNNHVLNGKSDTRFHVNNLHENQTSPTINFSYLWKLDIFLLSKKIFF